jgi:hypothetical protein
MERSINAARRRRLHVSPPQDEEAVMKPAPVDPDTPAPNDQPPPRLKARPKRTNPFTSFGDGSGIRSQAS